ncbi:MAG TPA: hypothetical protein VL261_13315 [Nitrospira sp.]|nr:hypothetical protein [Nitrospira sp.]
MRPICILLLAGSLVCGPALAGAVSMSNDPKGFRNIVWGSALNTRADLEPTRQGPSIIDYRFKNSPPMFAEIPVESLQLSTVDNQFARVTVRYRGEDTHKKILAYLESEFGRMERLPGQMLRGLNQQYNWRGSESEINLTYQAGTERGYVFIDSRTLAPRFNDLLADTAE